MEPNGLRKIRVVTKATQVTFHTEGNFLDYDGYISFPKLSGNKITFIKENVIYIDETNVADNSGSVSTA